MRGPTRGKRGGNYISEWFGQRIYPQVRTTLTSTSDADFGTCPFLSDVLGTPTKCVKRRNALGVCTISSNSNGARQDWLACPYRVIDSNIVTEACHRIFGSAGTAPLVPAPVLARPDKDHWFETRVQDEGVGYVFFQDKLGGEISVSGTERSPEMAFDVTIAEIVRAEETLHVSRYGILELQTMDFHGSYARAVSNLRSALDLHGSGFAEQLAANPEWAGDKIEGPNIANVFKRTFYQMVVKFQLAGHGAAAGTVLAIPQAVWDSWQPFLGRPELEDDGNGLKRFVPDAGSDVANSFICVFDLDADANLPISPVRVRYCIRVSAAQLAQHAFSRVPENMLSAIRDSDAVLGRIRARLHRISPHIV